MMRMFIGQKNDGSIKLILDRTRPFLRSEVKMAEGGNVPKLGGYDYEFIDKVPDDWECVVCNLTMKDPVQIVECGHRLCNICMESLLMRR